jgi:acyl carrier protein
LTGEALPPNLCNEWFAYYPNIPILNAYGPAECSDDATHYIIDKPFPPAVTTVPIGRPLPYVRLYVLDSHLQPVPIGVPGELYIGGIGVGRGYRNDPERTAQAFITDPFDAGPDARMYKTGDAVRYRSDGSLEFLGRLDYQVKLRGLRIELGEIETQLTQHPAVREAVVIVHEATTAAGASQHLVAYVVGVEPIDPELLRTYLGQKLPEYMIPTVFIELPALPLTPNGKLNRRALPTPDFGGDASQAVLPRTPTEETLATIWQHVLGLAQVGIHSNFFAIGGHSLLATQVVSRIRQCLQVELPLRRLFEAPTIAKLAEQIERFQVSQTLQQTRVDSMTLREEIEL